MEKPTEDFKFCSNCRRDIAVSNYLMHTMHCQRNLTLCKRCDEPIPRNEIDQHMQELHSQVPCGKCSAIVECCKLEDHMHTKCPKRTVKCSYCDLECILDEMKVHKSYCGSRTEICNICGQYVMIKDKEEHDLENCAKTVAKKQSENSKRDALNNMRVKQRSNGSSYKIPGGTIDNTDPQPETWSYQPNTMLKADTANIDILSDINQSTTLDEQLALDLAREDLENLQTEQYAELWEHSDDESALPYSRTSFPTMLGERAVIPGYNNDEFIIPVVNSVYDNHSDVETTRADSDEVELPCEFCGELYPGEVLIQHQSGCNPETAHGTTIKDFSDNSSTNNTQSVEEEKNLQEDINNIPCEFCNKCFPSNFLIQHESQCRPDIVHGPPPWIRKDKQLINKSSVVSTYTESNLAIPCEFCGELFPHQLVIDHQATCDANSLEPILSDELYPSIDKDTAERKPRAFKHQEDPQLEEITSILTSNTSAKDRAVSPLSNKKSIQVIEIGKSQNKELVPVNEANHSYSQSKSLCESSKRKNVSINFPYIDSYFERSERNRSRMQKDKSLEDIMRRVPDYKNFHDTSSHSYTPYRERNSHLYSEKVYDRDDWSNIPAGARPKNCSDIDIQDGLHQTVSLSRDTCIGAEPKPKFNSRMAASLPPLSENLPRGIRDTRPPEYSIKHTSLQPMNQGSENDIAGKSKSMKRKGMELYRR